MAVPFCVCLSPLLEGFSADSSGPPFVLKISPQTISQLTKNSCTLSLVTCNLYTSDSLKTKT